MTSTTFIACGKRMERKLGEICTGFNGGARMLYHESYHLPLGYRELKEEFSGMGHFAVLGLHEDWNLDYVHDSFWRAARTISAFGAYGLYVPDAQYLLKRPDTYVLRGSSFYIFEHEMTLESVQILAAVWFERKFKDVRFKPTVTEAVHLIGRCASEMRGHVLSAI